VVTTDASSKGIGASLLQIIPIRNPDPLQGPSNQKKFKKLYAIPAEIYQKMKVIIPPQT
jgi:hypothetical protein